MGSKDTAHGGRPDLCPHEVAKILNTPVNVRNYQ